jgi:hypothetical protein
MITTVQASTFWRTVVADEANLLDEIVRVLEARVSFCLIDGQAVNAYVEPLVSLDLDIVVAAADVAALLAALPASVRVETFPHSINLSREGSDLRIQLQTDPRYLPFIAGASRRSVLGMNLPVAGLEDVFQEKIWAVADPTRRPSKRQKDLADITRLVEKYPYLSARVPDEVRGRLM